MPKFNPFRPNSIVTPGMFVGRWEQMRSIEQSLFQTKHGNPRHFLVEGEKGIGKSSLLFSVECVADGTISISEEVKFDFLVLQVEFTESTTYEDIISKISSKFAAEVKRRQQVKEFAKSAWDFISNWKILGVEYKKENISPDVFLTDALAEAMATFLENAASDIEGILIMIDEADKPAVDSRLGEFVKLFSERLTKLRCDRVCLGLAGLPSLIGKLRDSHESSPRIFETLHLDPLSQEDATTVIRRGLSQAYNKSGIETKIDASALNAIVHLSEGYPHFIQQFAYCAFDVDSDDHISDEEFELHPVLLTPA